MKSLDKIAELRSRIAQLEQELGPRPKLTEADCPTEEVVHWVAFQMGLRFDDIMGHCRLARYVRARAAVFWGVRELRGLSLPEIGRRVGGRHHTTVLHGLRYAATARKRDPAFRLLTNRMVDAFTFRASSAAVAHATVQLEDQHAA